MLPYFERWMRRFPNWKKLADADEATVLKYWEGLGYYQRARNLHSLAKHLTDRHKIPKTPDAWELFKGIGPYTAAAITSITYNYPVPVVDGNVIRVLSRITANKTLFRDNGHALKVFTPIAEKLLNKEDPGNHNQALMELGATVCYRHAPLCTICPVWAMCEAAKLGLEETLPRFAEKRSEKIEISRLFCIRDNKLLLHKVPQAGKRLQGMYEFPRHESISSKTPDHKSLLMTGKRAISYQQILERIYSGKVPENGFSPPDCEWVPLSELDAITLSGPHRRWLKKLLSDKRIS